MHCASKWCSIIQATAQFTVAVAVAWAAFIVNEHMTTWSTALSNGADDLHQIRLSMEQINKDVETIGQNTTHMSKEIQGINMRMDHMNYNMNNIKRRMSPRSWMPF